MVSIVIIGSGCHRKLEPNPSSDPYRSAGCESSRSLPAILSAVRDAPGEGVVCIIPDGAAAPPSCDAVGAIYGTVSKPKGTYGVIVTRHSGEKAECQGAFDSTGKAVSDLPYVD